MNKDDDVAAEDHMVIKDLLLIKGKSLILEEKDLNLDAVSWKRKITTDMGRICFQRTR